MKRVVLFTLSWIYSLMKKAYSLRSYSLELVRNLFHVMLPSRCCKFHVNQLAMFFQIHYHVFNTLFMSFKSNLWYRIEMAKEEILLDVDVYVQNHIPERVFSAGI